MFTLNCKGKIVVLDQPLVMGIINATPDSFYKGNIDEDMLQLAATMIADGAAMLDIGGQSTKPGSARISTHEELNRVLPVITAIHQAFPDTIISIDTYNSKVATAAVKAGAAIVNDISGGDMDTAMLDTVAELQVPYVCMHMQGTPDNMQLNPTYGDVVTEVLDYCMAKVTQCKQAGITDIIIDPGFGFGKTIDHNLELLNGLSYFHQLNKPLLIGLSRKSTVYKTLNIQPEEALNGTTVLNTISLLNGAHILRVHDVKEAVQAVKLFSRYQKNKEHY